jgi:hypothetical protein
MEANKSSTVYEEKPFQERHSFLLFIIGSVLVSMVIVVISMAMYNGSGAAQLDLSRPGYISVRSQAAEGDSDFQSYSSVGKMDNNAINDFKKLFDIQVQKLKAFDAFGGSPSPLSPASLGIDDPDAEL